MGVYGQSKFAGEQQLQRDNPKHIIFRTSWVFSAHGNNFVKTMLRLSAEHEKLSVVGDQIGCPTYAGDLAQSIASVIIQIQKNSRFSNWGLYHCSNRGACSWYDFALAIFDAGVQSGLLSKIPSVNSITTAEYKAPTARPAYSVLDDAKLKVLLGQSMPHWNNGLKAVCLALR
jgi:dTDP-4-dehydrorhamnose reductase